MALNNLGPSVEAISGRERFVAVYSTAAVAGVTAGYFCSPQLSLGSSGKCVDALAVMLSKCYMIACRPHSNIKPAVLCRLT